MSNTPSHPFPSHDPFVSARPARLGVTESLRPRTCHLVDVENLIGDPTRWGVSQMHELQDSIYQSTSIAYQRRWVRADDLVWAACDQTRLLAIAPVWRPGELRVGRGKDGADRALLNVFDPVAAGRGCTRLIIGSGDSAFVDAAVSARRNGLHVVVVSWPWSLSRRLRRVAHEVHSPGEAWRAA